MSCPSCGRAQVDVYTLADQVTQRNASASEELASTAEEMSSQAEGLQQTIGYFKTAGQRDVVVPAARATVTPFRPVPQLPAAARTAAPAAFGDYTHF